MGVGGPNVKRQRFVNFHINSAFTAGRAEFMSRLTADPRAVLITIVHARRVSATHTRALGFDEKGGGHRPCIR